MSECFQRQDRKNFEFCSHKNCTLTPDYNLMVKIGGVYRLLRNLSIDMGLVKNIQVIVTRVGPKLIAIHILHADSQTLKTGNTDILLPCITFKNCLPSSHTLCHCQFPLTPTYASTLHSCQGLTLDRVGVCHEIRFSGLISCFTILSVLFWTYYLDLFPYGLPSSFSFSY